VENLWRLKVILRQFELILESKVNFSKSELYATNAGSSFMGLVVDFLNYQVGKFPFKYFDLFVGANPRKASMKNVPLF
jgi:hypothetical protein